MPGWIKDEHGQIKLPTPDYGLGTGRRAGLGLAEAAGQWADVLARMEEQKQKLEVLDWTQAYQDKEQDRLSQMAQLKGKDGVDRAVAFMEEFYETENPKLMEKARGDFQGNYLGSFLAHSRDAGLNRAYAHQIREFETYQGQVWAGETAKTMAQIEADPENHEIYLAGLNQLDANMNPGDDPAFRAAKARQRRDQGLETAIMALARAGKYDEAERLLMETFGASEAAGGGLTSPLAGSSRITSPFGPRDHRAIDPEKALAGQPA